MTISRRQFLAGAAALGLTTGMRPQAHAAKAKLPFPELTAAGSHGAIGEKIGRTFAKQIEHNVGFYLDWLSGAKRAEHARILKTAGRFAPVLKNHLPGQLEEMEGMARAAGRTLDEILVINARTDLGVLTRPRSKDGAEPGCTALALTGRSAARPKLALGQNWDWNKKLTGNTVILRLAPDRGPRVVAFAEAGMTGKIGFNQHRLGVCLNFLAHASDNPNGEPGVPVHSLLRAVMDCRTLEEAVKLVAWVPRCASANFLIAQHTKAGPAVANLEWTPDAVARLAPSGMFLVHTNHFKTISLAPGCQSGMNRSTKNRHDVATVLAAELAVEIPDPVSRMKHILASREGEPHSVSKTGAPDSPSATLAGIVMDLSGNRLHLTPGPPHLNTWFERPGA